MENAEEREEEGTRVASGKLAVGSYSLFQVRSDDSRVAVVIREQPLRRHLVEESDGAIVEPGLTTILFHTTVLHLWISTLGCTVDDRTLPLPYNTT